MKFRWCFLCIASLVCGQTVGCSGKSAGKPVTAAAQGIVLYNDKPVAGAAVVFYPDKGPTAIGQTDAAGAFTLKLTTGEDGAVVGANKISITLPPKIDESTPTDSDAAIAAQAAAPALPVKYATPETSELTKTVTKDGPNKLELKLTD
jgi:hypothetical protein